MKTTRRFACTAALMLPAAALAGPAELPTAPQGCETPALHETLRAELIRTGGPAGQPPAPARCPRCGCDLFSAPTPSGDIPDLRNLF